jgi:hypothetical protein
MDVQDVVNAYYSTTTIEALLYENFDATPEWRQVKVKSVEVGPEGLDWIELLILKDGWPTPWHATMQKAKFATDLRAVPNTVEGSIARPITDEGRLLK